MGAKLESILASRLETKCMLVNLNNYKRRDRERGATDGIRRKTSEAVQTRFETQMVEDGWCSL